MKNVLRFTLLLLSCCSLGAATVMTQDAVPREILERTLFIKVGNDTGTAFKIEHGGKVYLVTARHVVASLSADNKLQISRNGEWHDYPTVRLLLPASPDADVAVFETNEKLEQPYEIKVASDKGTTLGQQVWFLGYPYDFHSFFAGTELPFIKRATMSAVDSRNPNAITFWLDGFNNPGFSGGPVVFWSFSAHDYEITGVILGFESEPAKSIQNGMPREIPIYVNSGIIKACSIKHVLETIERAAP